MLDLKAQYKSLTGSDYAPGKPPRAPAATSPAASASSGDEAEIYKKVFDQGEKLRSLKSAKAPKVCIDC